MVKVTHSKGSGHSHEIPPKDVGADQKYQVSGKKSPEVTKKVHKAVDSGKQIINADSELSNLKEVKNTIHYQNFAKLPVFVQKIVIFFSKIFQFDLALLRSPINQDEYSLEKRAEYEALNPFKFDSDEKRQEFKTLQVKRKEHLKQELSQLQKEVVPLRGMVTNTVNNITKDLFVGVDGRGEGDVPFQFFNDVIRGLVSFKTSNSVTTSVSVSDLRYIMTNAGLSVKEQRRLEILSNQSIPNAIHGVLQADFLGIPAGSNAESKVEIDITQTPIQITSRVKIVFRDPDKLTKILKTVVGEMRILDPFNEDPDKIDAILTLIPSDDVKE